MRAIGLRYIMGAPSHQSRRQILESVVVVASGVLLPAGNLRGQAAPGPYGALSAKILNAADGEETSAKVRIVDQATGAVHLPDAAIKTMPQTSDRPIRRYFYARGAFEVSLAPGSYRLEVVRGICHQDVVKQVEIVSGRRQHLEISIPPIKDWSPQGWYSGNTHTHYNLGIDENPDDRLRIGVRPSLMA